MKQIKINDIKEEITFSEFLKYIGNLKKIDDAGKKFASERASDPERVRRYLSAHELTYYEDQKDYEFNLNNVTGELFNRPSKQIERAFINAANENSKFKLYQCIHV